MKKTRARRAISLICKGFYRFLLINVSDVGRLELAGGGVFRISAVLIPRYSVPFFSSLRTVLPEYSGVKKRSIRNFKFFRCIYPTVVQNLVQKNPPALFIYQSVLKFGSLSAGILTFLQEETGGGRAFLLFLFFHFLLPFFRRCAERNPPDNIPPNLSG